MEFIVEAWHSAQYLLLIVIEKWVIMCLKNFFWNNFFLIVWWLIGENFGFETTYSWFFIFSEHQDCLGEETLGNTKPEIKIFVPGPKSFLKSTERKSIKDFQAQPVFSLANAKIFFFLKGKLHCFFVFL